MFTVERIEDSSGKPTGFKVLDENAKDVTADFKWLNDFLVMS